MHASGRETSIRFSVRVLLIDPQERVLMLAAKDPADGRVVWFVPGGCEPDESLEQTARRELAEEVGLIEPPSLEGPIWIWGGGHRQEREGEREVGTDRHHVTVPTAEKTQQSVWQPRLWRAQ
ncbi:MAG: NUDIX domain-containing protein [Actinomycetota bacterium]